MVGYKDGMEEDWECWEHGGTCHYDKPGHWGEQKEGRKKKKKLCNYLITVAKSQKFKTRCQAVAPAATTPKQPDYFVSSCKSETHDKA